MQEGYQIIELKNRVSDVLTQTSIKVSDVLTLLGQRCADSYHLKLTFKGIRLGFLEKNIKNNKWFTDNSLGKSPGVDCD